MRTHTERAAAKAIAICGWTALMAAGCSPDLERRAGVVQVVALNLPAAATSLRATIQSGTSLATQEAPLVTSGGRLRFEGVPEGTATLSAQAVADAVSIERQVELVVQAAHTTSVAIDFGAVPSTDGGTPISGQAFGPTPAFVRGLGGSDVEGTTLRATTDGIDGVFASQLAAARQALGAPLTHLRVTGVTVVLNTATSREVSTLDALWDGDVEISVNSRQSPLRAVVARGALGAGATQQELAGASDQGALDVLVEDLAAGRVDLQLSGSTTLRDSSDFRAELSVLVRWLATSD